MSAFTVRGKFQARDGWQEFETSIEAENEDVAREHTFANFGSQYGLKRTQIEVSEVEGR
jgi:large subunit ribosomal protein LX